MDWARIKRITRGALSIGECEYLSRFASMYPYKRALEVGHYTGLSTIVLLTSLPYDCSLTTIDHHLGDPWSPGTNASEFTRNVDHYIGERDYRFLEADMRDALPLLTAPYDFVFYDADHSAAAVGDFWMLVQPLLAPNCVIVYDDADWPGQMMLAVHAQRFGFQVATPVEHFRDRVEDKADPATFTLEMLVRGNPAG